MTAFVYCWSDHKTGKVYVGYHKGFPDDGYIASSKIFKEEYKKRPKDFTRQIIATGTVKEMITLEAAILVSADAKNDPSFYNMNNQKFEYCPTRHDTWRKHIGEANKGRARPDLASKNRQRVGKANPRYGRGTTDGKKIYHCPETKKQKFFAVGQQPKGWVKGYADPERNHGANNPMYGRRKAK